MSPERLLQMARAGMLWFQSALLPTGWAREVRIVVEGGLVARIEAGVAPVPGDERNAIAVPGFANLHSHGFQRGLAGLTELRGPGNDNFWTWREVMYRFLDRLEPEDVEAITAQAYVEMLECGFTRVGEFHYLHHDPSGRPYANPAELTERIAAAAHATGIALTMLPVFYAHANLGGVESSAGQRRFVNGIDAFAQLFSCSASAIAELEDATLGVAPHSLRAVTPEELSLVVGLAPKGPIHIHAAEQIKEVEDCLAWSGLRPVEWLLERAQIDGRWCLIHATHVTERETQRLAASDATAGLCPVTEANLGDGIFPAAEFIEAGGRFGIGTDSNVLIDAPQELRALEYSQRLVKRARNVLAPPSGGSTGRDLFERALEGGAKALGVPLWGLREGAPADIVSFDLAQSAFVGRGGDAVLDSWIFAGGSVDCVWRRGRKLVAAGRHADRELIQARYSRVMQKLLV